MTGSKLCKADSTKSAARQKFYKKISLYACNRNLYSSTFNSKPEEETINNYYKCIFQDFQLNNNYEHPFNMKIIWKIILKHFFALFTHPLFECLRTKYSSGTHAQSEKLSSCTYKVLRGQQIIEKFLTIRWDRTYLFRIVYSL